MSKVQKIMLGTMLAASLLGPKVAAQPVSNQKAKPKMGLTEQKEKSYRDPGIYIAKRGGNIFMEIDIKKISESVREQKKVLDNVTAKFATKYLKENSNDMDNPYNLDYFSRDKLKFIQREVKETARKTTDAFFNLPLNQKEYKKVKGMLISLLLMTQDADVVRGMRMRDILRPNDSYDYARFVRIALQIKMVEMLINQELSNLRGPNPENTPAQKTR
jgi:hypothetical protein